MAAITITAADVTPGANAVVVLETAGENAITAGEPVRKTSNKVFAASNATAAAAAVIGIALANAATNQPVAVITGGDISFGDDVLTVGLIYAVGDSAGQIVPSADLGSGDFTTILGVAKTASVLSLDIQRSGVAQA